MEFFAFIQSHGMGAIVTVLIAVYGAWIFAEGSDK